MLEIPESQTIAKQLTQTIEGKTIRKVTANTSPHGFAFYFGNPGSYQDLLGGKRVNKTSAVAGQIEIEVQEARILLGDGVNVRYFPAGEPIPEKHQLHIEFDDFSSIVCTIQMYGGLWAFADGENHSPYYIAAKEKPSPLTDQFSEKYFSDLISNTKQTISIKAFLATEQRIPGLGNGALQDILFNAGINPKSKLNSLSDSDRVRLFKSIKQTLFDMTAKGGRDTEKDLFGRNGGYQTILSKNTMEMPCPVCGGAITRQAYMGGNIYFCPVCQSIH